MNHPDDADGYYCTFREIQNVCDHELAKLDKELWPRENACVSRALVIEHFVRLKHELFKIGKRPRDNANLLDGDGKGGAVPIPREPSDWDTTAQAEFERNRERYFEKVRSHRSAAMGLGRGKDEG